MGAFTYGASYPTLNTVQPLTIGCAASDDVSVKTLETIGNLLNVIGVLVALTGLIVETRLRRLDLLGERVRRVVARLQSAWRNMAIREPQQRVFSGSADEEGIPLWIRRNLSVD